jgi:hypothetical protein
VPATRRGLILRTTLAAALLVAPGCNQLNLFWNADLEFAYLGDDAGRVERASVSTGTRVIATARRSGTRTTTDPDVTEIDVDETHFVRGTLEVVYTGSIVFECRTGEAWCRATRVTPVSGTRPRNVFRRWPLRIDGLDASA